MKALAVIALVFAVLLGIQQTGIGGIAARAQDDTDTSAEGHSLDLYRTGADTSGLKGGKTYADYDRDRDGDWLVDFHGFGCLDRCDGHEAGYAWAKAQHIGDPADCGGNSWNFEEGCVAFTRDLRA